MVSPSLPPELILVILDYAVGAARAQRRDARLRRPGKCRPLVALDERWTAREGADLCSFARISRAWWPAAAMLWRFVNVKDERAGIAFVAAADTREGEVPPTQTLWIGEKVPPWLAKQVLGRCAVEELICHYGALEDWEASLGQANLRSLKSFMTEGRATVPVSAAPHASAFPWSLSSLDLSWCAMPPSLLCSIFASSSQTLRLLNIRGLSLTGGERDQQLAAAFALVAPRLRSVSLSPPSVFAGDGEDEKSGMCAFSPLGLIEFIRVCGELSQLHLGFIDDPHLLLAVLHALPCPAHHTLDDEQGDGAGAAGTLEELHLEVIDEYNPGFSASELWEELGECVAARTSLSGLKRIRLDRDLKGVIDFGGCSWKDYHLRGGVIDFNGRG